MTPEEVVKLGYLTGVDDPENQIQPNGIDVRLHSLRRIIDGGAIVSDFPRTDHPCEKKKPRTVEIRPTPFPSQSLNEFFELEAGQSYQADAYEYVKVPGHLMAEVIGRSSLNRGGVFVRSTVYDSGFENTVGFVLYVFAPMKIQRGARVAQILFSPASSGHLYSGQYQDQKTT